MQHTRHFWPPASFHTKLQHAARLALGIAVTLIGSGLCAPHASASLPLPPPPRTEADPPLTRLELLLEQSHGERARIENSSQSLAECDRRMREWRAAPRPQEEVQFLEASAAEAVAVNPHDWRKLGQVIYLAKKGCQSAKLVSLLSEVIDAPKAGLISEDHFKVILFGMQTIGCQRLPESEALLKRWLQPATWQATSYWTEDYPRESVQYECNAAAITGASRLEPKRARAVLNQALRQFRPCKADSDPATQDRMKRLRAAAERYLDDLKRLRKGHPPEHHWMWGYGYYGPGAGVYR